MKDTMQAINDSRFRFPEKRSAGDLLGSRGGSHPATGKGEVNLSAQGCTGENDLGYQKEEKKFNKERGCTTMKKGLILALVLVAGMIGLSYAEVTDTMNVTVSCQFEEAISITETCAYGALATGASAVSSELAVTNASNASSASIMYLKLHISSQDSLTQWTAAADPEIEVYSLSAVFAPTASAPVAGDFEADDVLTGVAQYWDLTSGDVFNGNANKEYSALTGSGNRTAGYRGKCISTNISGGFADRKLYLLLETPLAVRSTASHTIVVTVTGTGTAE